MRKLIPVYVRIRLLYALMFGVLEYFIDSGDRPALVKYPVVALFHVVFIFLLIAIEVVLNSVNKVTYQLLYEEEKAKLEADKNKPLAQQEAFKNWMRKLTASRSINEEKDMLLDHDYDGIKELDNVLPPWWVGLFYATVIFALVYLVRFHIVGDYDQAQEFKNEVELAELENSKNAKAAPDDMNVDKVTLLTDAASLAKGKEIFTNACAACHKADGGGLVGPNLTDKNWINGGGIKNVFKLISEGSKNNATMVAWNKNLKPTEIQSVASYILSLQGTNPAGAKAAEGEIWVEEAATAQPAEKVSDSTKVATPATK